MAPGVRIIGRRWGAFEQALEIFRHVDIDISIGFVVGVEEDDGGLAFREDVIRNVISRRRAAIFPVWANDGKDAGIVAAADQILRDDQFVRGVVEDAGPRAAALTR